VKKNKNMPKINSSTLRKRKKIAIASLLLFFVVFASAAWIFLPNDPAEAAATDILISEVRVSPAQVSPNLQPNPSYETWTSSSQLEPWYDMNEDEVADVDEYCDFDSSGTRNSYDKEIFSGGSITLTPLDKDCGSVTEETTDVYHGTSAVKIVTGDNEIATVKFADGSRTDIEAATQYTVSFYAKGSIGNESIYLKLDHFDVGFVEHTWDFDLETFGVNDTIPASSSMVRESILTTSWTRYSYTFTTGDEAGFLDVQIISGGTGIMFDGSADQSNQTFYIDALQVEAAASATSFMSADVTSATFFELYNPTAAAIDLNNYNLEYKFDANEWADLAVVSEATSLAAGKHYLIKASGGDKVIANEATFNSAYTTNSITISGMALRVCSNSADCASTIKDTVGLGDATVYEGTAMSTTGWNTAKSFERKAYSTSTSVTMASGGADEVAGNGYDSEVNNSDFVLLTTPVPQAMAATAEIYVAPVTGGSASSQRAAQENYDILLGLDLDDSGAEDTGEVPPDDTTITEEELLIEEDNVEPDDQTDGSDTEVIEESPEESLIPESPVEKNIIMELEALKDFIAINGVLPNADDWAVIHFLSYDSSGFEGVSLNDRVGLIEDYYDLYGRMPNDEADWEVVLSMSTGEKTEVKINEFEIRALKEFISVYGRLVDFSVPQEERFVHMVAYHLRPMERNLVLENAALIKFVTTYNQIPDTPLLWSVLRAIAYAGVE